MTSKSWWLALETKLTTSFILLGVLSPWFSFVRNSFVMWVHCFHRVPYCITLILYLFLSIYFVAIFSHNGCCTMHFISRCFTHTNVPIYRLAILFTFFSNSFHGFCFMLMHCRLFSAEPKAKPVIINYKITSQWCAYNEHITLYSPLHFIREWARPNSFFFLHSLPFFNSLGWLQNHFPFIFHPIASLLAFVFLHEWNK